MEGGNANFFQKTVDHGRKLIILHQAKHINKTYYRNLT